MAGLVPAIHVFLVGQRRGCPAPQASEATPFFERLWPGMTACCYFNASSKSCFNCAWCFDICPTAVAADAGRVA
jgi:ferredoxin